MTHHEWRYEKLLIAGDFLSSYTKVEAGCNLGITYWLGNFLYCLSGYLLVKIFHYSICN